MGLFKQRANLYDPFRCLWVAATSEEIVRQRLLETMVGVLGFPKELVAVEKQLSKLPHLKQCSSVPKRRADILCFAKWKETLSPLLLIECKEGEGKSSAKSQVLGYNHYVRAPFVAVAGADFCHLVFPYDLPFLPSFSQLLERVSN